MTGLEDIKRSYLVKTTSTSCKETHDKLGHHGFYPTQHTVADHFWWPLLDQDVTWYIKTCHQCQIHCVDKVVLPPVVATPAPLFRKAYVDTMHMPKSHRFSYIVQAHCSLSAWPEFRMLCTETGHTLGTFIFEEILCCWGGLEEIVTDNGTPFIATLDWLAQTYHIHCHAPNTFGTVNMEHTIDSRLSGSER